MRKKYIYQFENWANFTWEEGEIQVLLGKVRLLQGKVLGTMLTLLAACLLLVGLIGCADIDTAYDMEPFYVNNSGVSVKLTAIIEERYGNADSNYFKHIYIHSKQELKNNDTLCSNKLNENCSGNGWWIPSGMEGFEGNCPFIKSEGNYCSKPIYFKIEFLSDPKVCLVFDGEEIENDIRYWENYVRIRKELDNPHVYSYTITPALMQQAKEENCE